MSSVYVSDIMTRDVVTVRPDDTLLAAAKLLHEHGFEGLPVVDEEGILRGLLAEANLISGSSHIHLPTLLAFLDTFDLYRKDRSLVKSQLDSLLSLRVRDVMNEAPPLVYEGETIDRTIMQLGASSGVSPISVVTQSRKLLGVVTRHDVLKLYSNPASEVPGRTMTNSKVAETRIAAFMKSFHDNFLFISRWRTRAWLLINAFFLVAGVVIAALMMLRIRVL